MTTLRPFHITDTDACLALFDSNVPRFFAPHERAGFCDFLAQPGRPTDYRVLVQRADIVACGGLWLAKDGSASLCWGMVARTHHRQGLGKVLTLARLAQARSLGATRLTLSTSQHTQAFYAALGFTVLHTNPDGHGPGLDAVDMAHVLTVPR